MEKIYKYMDKIGIEYDKTTFGNSYFENVPKISFSAAYVILKHGDINTAAYKNLVKYCKRWNYSLTGWAGYPGYNVMKVCQTDDKKRLDIYLEYMKKSVEACEKTMHLRCLGYFDHETDREFNERLRGKMEFYGEELKTALEQAENGAAA